MTQSTEFVTLNFGREDKGRKERKIDRGEGRERQKREREREREREGERV